MKYTEINSPEAACIAVGTTLSAITAPFGLVPDKYSKPLEAHALLVVGAEAINEEWQPDYSDPSQPKYELWLRVVKDDSKPSGFGLVFHVIDNWATFTHVGSRLCFKDRARARHFFEIFQVQLEDYMLIEK